MCSLVCVIFLSPDMDVVSPDVYRRVFLKGFCFYHLRSRVQQSGSRHFSLTRVTGSVEDIRFLSTDHRTITIPLSPFLNLLDSDMGMGFRWKGRPSGRNTPPRPPHFGSHSRVVMNRSYDQLSGTEVPGSNDSPMEVGRLRRGPKRHTEKRFRYCLSPSLLGLIPNTPSRSRSETRGTLTNRSLTDNHSHLLCRGRRDS